MAFPVFPNIMPPSYPFGERLENPALTSTMENGIVLSRPRFTRIRKTFTLKWSALPASDYEKLRSFWQTVLGGSQEFSWTYPAIPGDSLSGKEYTVRFANGDIRFDLASNGYYSGDLTLQEV